MGVIKVSMEHVEGVITIVQKTLKEKKSSATANSRVHVLHLRVNGCMVAQLCNGVKEHTSELCV